MTVRKFKASEVERIEKIGCNMKTPRGEQFIDHMIYFKNGAAVAYDNANRDGFVWVVEARR